MKSHVALAAGLSLFAFVLSAPPRLHAQQPPVEILAPTFSQHVAPIVYAKCLQCHRPGEVAPMSLINYRDVEPWAGPIRRQLVDGDPALLPELPILPPRRGGVPRPTP